LGESAYGRFKAPPATPQSWKKITKKKQSTSQGSFVFFTHSNRISEYFLHFIFSIKHYSFFRVSIL
jgi:hypothetical protein